jgi:hypothetical protein
VNISITTAAIAVTSCTKRCTALFESTNMAVLSRSDSYFARNRNSGATNQYGPALQEGTTITLLCASERPAEEHRFALSSCPLLLELTANLSRWQATRVDQIRSISHAALQSSSSSISSSHPALLTTTRASCR